MSNEKASRFKPGDHVFVQLYKDRPHLYSDDNIGRTEPRPKRLMVRGVVRTCDFDRGYSENSRPVAGTEVTKYITSYDDRMLDEDQLFDSVAEFEELRGDEIRELEVKRQRESQDKRLQSYRDAKRLVADFEAEMFTAQSAITPERNN